MRHTPAKARIALAPTAALAAVACALAPTAASAATKPGPLVPDTLRAHAAAHPAKQFRVIVQGARGQTSKKVAATVAKARGRTLRRFITISGVDASVSGRTLLTLARNANLRAVTPDDASRSEGTGGAGVPADAEMWRDTTGLTPFEADTAVAPAVAVVDSGVDAGTLESFGVHVRASVDFSNSADGAVDDEGHGTMVAGIAGSTSAPGSIANAPIVSIRTADANGRSRTSDVIAAADWILLHAGQYNIRVANFSMSADSMTSFRLDPLDKAVERLWFYGIVVVAAAGNHGSADGAVDMSRAPGNDPFVITVGASDQQGTALASDDTIAPWSAHGWSIDGFRKPELVAPGRYMVMPAPMTSALAAARPERVTGVNRMWMSGTSFAAPVVAGAAAELLGVHQDWTPDDVKGALMYTAKAIADTAGGAGVGEIDAYHAALLNLPPNANENLYAFVTRDPATNAPSFEPSGWTSTVAVDPTWSSANWSGANWSGANWSGANWSGANWSGANWSGNAWSAGSWESDVSSASYSSDATDAAGADIQ